MPSASLALYRSLAPGHALVPDATVEVWLEQAVTAHNADAWGAVYASAMCLWAAAQIEALRSLGQAGEVGGCTPAAKPVPVESTVFWSMYAGYRRSRAAGAPTRVLS